MTNAALPSGAYPIERRAGEVDRLRHQSDAWAPDTGAMLDAIGVGPGWHCLDLACGPGGITDMLAGRVVPSGSVTGLDADAEFLDIARCWGPAEVRYIQGDAYATGLPDGSFDLVHIRFLASTAGQPGRLIAEARRLLKPGGTLAMQEADFPTLRCYPPHPAWAQLAELFASAFPGHDSDDPVAQQLYRMLRQAGFQDVQYRPRLVGTRAGDAWQDYLPATVESLRSGLVAQGRITDAALDDLLAQCRAHLALPDTTFTSITCVQVWGQRVMA